MKKKYILDAGILALYFAGNEKVRKYIDEVYEGRTEVLISEVNIAEFLYNYAKVFGWEAALAKNSLIRKSPLKIEGVDEDLTLEAARLKLKHYNVLSLADCYLIALAKRYNSTIVTTDHEIKKVDEAPTILIPIK